jgi:hypothetical protein
MSQAKARVNGIIITLPLSFSQGSIRIADKDGNHFPSPTQTINDKGYFVEWMITNNEIKLLSTLFKKKEGIAELIKVMQKISKFAEDSEYSRRTTSSGEKEIAKFEGFKIYQYMDVFNSFEKVLDSTLKVRLTFKLGDYGVTSHPHMYVLVPFNFKALKIKNREGNVENNQPLGSGCFAELNLTEDELKEIILTLAHASSNHRNDLIRVLES